MIVPLRDINPTQRRPVVTYALIGINIGIFLMEVSLTPRELEAFIYRWGMVPFFLTTALNVDSLSTPLTSMFLHGDWLHLITNMWMLYIFGDNVEDRMGMARFVVFYALCGVAAAAAQLLTDPSSRVPMVGASGAISGVLAAYLKLFPGARVIALVLILIMEVPAVFFILVWFMLQLVQGIQSLGLIGTNVGGVAFFAHIGGFVAGLYLMERFLPRRKSRTGGGPQPPVRRSVY